MTNKSKRGSWAAALKMQLQQCCTYPLFEDADEYTSLQEFGTSSCEGAAKDSMSTVVGSLADDHAAVVSSSQCRQSSSYETISEYVDGHEQEEEELDELDELELLKHSNRSRLREELELSSVSLVELTCNIVPGAPTLPAIGLKDHGPALMKHIYESGKLDSISTGAGVEAEMDTDVGKGGFRISGKLSTSRPAGRSRGANVEKPADIGRPCEISWGTDVEEAVHADCASSRSDSFSQSRLIRRLEHELELQPTLTVSTQMSKTNNRRQIPRTDFGHPRAAATLASGTKHAWNASTRTAQDCQALLLEKERALLKRERAIEYAQSIGRFRQKGRSDHPWLRDEAERTPDKPGWVWSWLERAARMGTSGSRDNPLGLLDNDSKNPRDGRSESSLMSVQSTVAVICTTGTQIHAADGACSELELSPRSLREPVQSLPGSDYAESIPSILAQQENEWSSRMARARIITRADHSCAHDHLDAAEEPRDPTNLRQSRTSADQQPLHESPARFPKLKYHGRCCGTRRSWTNQMATTKADHDQRCMHKDKGDDHDEQDSLVESVGSCGGAAPVASAAITVRAPSSKHKLSSQFNTGAAAGPGPSPESRLMKSRGTAAGTSCDGDLEVATIQVMPATIQAAGEIDQDAAASEDHYNSVDSTATSLRKKLRIIQAD